MKKVDSKLVGVAIIVAALGIGAYLYNSTEEIEGFEELPEVANELPSDTPTDTAVPEETLPEVGPETVTDAEVAPILDAQPEQVYVDPLDTHNEEVKAVFKSKIKLGIDLPADMRFEEIEIDADDVAVLQGGTVDGARNMTVIGSTKTGSPETIAAFLGEQKNHLSILGNQDFKLSGAPKLLPGPKNSGFSKVTVLPGPKSNGYVIYAAHLQRADGKGSYVILLKDTVTEFGRNDGEIDRLYDSLSAK